MIRVIISSDISDSALGKEHFGELENEPLNFEESSIRSTQNVCKNMCWTFYAIKFQRIAIRCTFFHPLHVRCIVTNYWSVPQDIAGSLEISWPFDERCSMNSMIPMGFCPTGINKYVVEIEARGPSRCSLSIY